MCFKFIGVSSFVLKSTCKKANIQKKSLVSENIKGLHSTGGLL